MYMQRKYRAFTSLAFLVVMLVSCRKQEVATFHSNQALSLQEARAYFENQVASTTSSGQGAGRKKAMKEPVWSRARNVGSTWVVPVHFSPRLYLQANFAGTKVLDLDQVSSLFIFRDSAGQFQAQWVTAIPDSTYLAIGATGPFSGIALVEDWGGNEIYKLRYQPDGAVSVYDPGSVKKSGVVVASDKVQTTGVIVVCYEIRGYNYSQGDPNGGYSWTESAGCSINFIADRHIPSGFGVGYGDRGGGAGGGSGLGARIGVVNGHSIIADIKDYMKCFTNVGGSDHSYQVTVCVDQPNPGTRDTWGFAGQGSWKTHNPVNVGHTFLIFSETYGGVTITRNVGFYPRSGAKPGYETDQGQLNNDAGHDYNIAVQVTVNNGQFFNMLNFAAQGNNPGYMYDLNANNCTSFALHTLAAGNVVLPATVGSWAGGGGLDPGDLGEDLRAMSLSPNMKRLTTEAAHPNVGTCN